MIRKPTVLVLGAGASCPYGFYTGAGLARRFHWRLTDGSAYRQTIQEYGVGEQEILEFIEAFPQSSCDTLDEFVQSKGNARFLAVVKAGIVEELIACEREETLLHPLTNDPARVRTWNDADWCGYLLRVMRTDADEGTFGNNRVKVVTFNFDRSFERRLFLSVQRAYGLGAHDAGLLQARIPILHLHGRLGGEKWLGENRPESRAYDPASSAAQKREVVQHIRLVHDEIDRNDVTRARGWLTEAETVCFLGFGYHPINLQRLDVSALTKVIRGTAYGLTEHEIGPIRSAFQVRVHLYPEFDCMRLLRNTAVLHEPGQ